MPSICEDVMLLSLDPGISTGVAFYSYEIDTYHTFVTREHEKIYDLLKDMPHQGTVIIERFQAELISSYGLHTVRLVGGVEAICYIRDIKFVRQMPQQRKGFIKLAQQIINSQGAGWVIHEVDALAHLLFYRYKMGEIDGR